MKTVNTNQERAKQAFMYSGIWFVLPVHGGYHEVLLCAGIHTPFEKISSKKDTRSRNSVLQD